MEEKPFKAYDFEHPSFHFKLEDKLKALLGGPLFYNPYYKTFSLKGNENVLDFGCGGGTGSKCLIRFLTEGGRLTCIDISEYWINQARRRLRKYPNAESMVGDIRKLNIPDGSFDVISIMYVIHDIEPAQRLSTVQALSRILKNDGVLYLREPTRKSHGMFVEEIGNLFTRAGFREIDARIKKLEYMGRFQHIG